MGVQAEPVDQQGPKGSRLNVTLEISHERQMPLVTEQDVGPWAVQGVGMGVEESGARDGQQVAAGRVPGVGGVNRRWRRAHIQHVMQHTHMQLACGTSGDAELRFEGDDLDPYLTAGQREGRAVGALELGRIANAGPAPL
jgi:hypothetical protein